MAKVARISLGILLTLLLTGCGINSQGGAPSMGRSDVKEPATSNGMAARGGGTYLDVPLPEGIKHLELFDSDGKKFTLGSLNGRYLVISNFLTSCQEICPMTSANMRDIGAAIAKAGLSKKVLVVEISVDSMRDTPSRISAYKALYSSNDWVVASGSESSLKSLWKFFGAPAQKEMFSTSDLKNMPPDWQTGKQNSYDMVHADLVTIVDSQGHWRWLDLGSPKISSKVPDKLRSFLSPQGLKNLTKPEEPTWSTAAVMSALKDLTGFNI
jgi:cytochrome oxidase Cu insertion factor (SCO1/SenC/PrrC family)